MQTITIVGRLGQDSEVKVFGDREYLSFSVGINFKKQGVEQTQWYSCLKYGKNENLQPYLTKGTQVVVSGELRLSAYINKDGIAMPSPTINVNTLELVGSKQDNQQQPQNVQNNMYGNKSVANVRQQAVNNGNNLGADDLPF